MQTLTKEHARFILAAVCRDPFRLPLVAPHVSEIGGALWVCATDGHRLHAVRAPEGSQPGYVHLTKDGAIAPLAKTDAKFPSVEDVWQAGQERSAVQLDVERAQAVSSTKHEKMRVKIGVGDEARDPRPHFEGDPTPNSCVIIFARYFAESLLAVPGGKKAPAFVKLARGRDGLDPIVITEDRDAPTWRAVVMPLRA